MSQECKLILYTERNSEGDSEEFTGDRALTNNDQSSSYKMTGDCYNTAWALFEDNHHGGKGVIVGEHDKGGPLRGDYPRRYGDKRKVHDGNLNDDGIILSGLGATGRVYPRFTNHENKISFVKKVEFPEFPAGTIIEDVLIYGRRANPTYGQPDHYPYVNSMDIENPNRSNQVTATTQGQPCPGATIGVPIGDRTYRCAYENSSQIQSLHSTIKDISAIYDPRIDLYGRVVSKFCDNVENINAGVGGGLTCEDMGASRETWCSVGERIKTEPSCSKALIGNDLYHKIAEAYCIANPGDEWCTCYNLKNNVCERTAIPMNSTAAGCKHAYGILEGNKKAFGPGVAMQSAETKVADAQEGTPAHTEAVANLAELKKKDGYPILVDNVHCRPDACESVLGGGYIPENPKGSCAASYNFCDQDIDIKNMSNMDIIVACNTGLPYTKPSWWDDPIVPYERERKFPYNKFPLNKTPMFRFPLGKKKNGKRQKFRWKSKNDRYHAYSAGGVSGISCVCCILLLLIMRMSKKGRR